MSEAPPRIKGLKSNRRLLLLVPSFHNYENRIVEAAESLGYECLRLDERIGNGAFEKILTRIGLVQKIKPLMKRYFANLVKAAREFDPDVVLVVNAETLDEALVRRFRASLPSARFLIYMWDSSSKKKISREMYAQFDRAFSFDPEDCERIDMLHHIPLFHLNSEIDWDMEQEGQDFDYECTFIGTARIRRMIILARAARQLVADGKRFYFYLYTPSLAHYMVYLALKALTGFRGIVSRESVPYEAYQAIIARSASCIDIEQSNQKGLTIRTLEVVFSGRPLITTNSWVSEYDFYNEFPVSVFDAKGELQVRRQRPTLESRKLFKKYSLHQWLSNILDEREDNYFIKRGGKSISNRNTL